MGHTIDTREVKVNNTLENCSFKDMHFIWIILAFLIHSPIYTYI